MTEHPRRALVFKVLKFVLFSAIFFAALWAAKHEFQRLSVGGLRQALRHLSAIQIAKAAGLTLASYALLTTYDLLGARYARLKLSTPFVLLVSFISYSMTNNIGFGSVTGSSVRYRFYTHWGAGVADVVRIVAFCGTTFWLGFALLAGWALFTGEAEHLGRLAFIAPFAPAIAVVLLGIVVAYIVFCWFWRGTVTFHGQEIYAPPHTYAIAQPFMGAADWILAASVFYVLLPHEVDLHFSAFLHAFLLAQMIGLVSHVPGGLGVFDGLLMYSLGDAITPEKLAASLVAFRCIYYLVPLMTAILAMLGLVIGERRNAPAP